MLTRQAEYALRAHFLLLLPLLYLLVLPWPQVGNAISQSNRTNKGCYVSLDQHSRLVTKLEQSRNWLRSNQKGRPSSFCSSGQLHQEQKELNCTHSGWSTSFYRAQPAAKRITCISRCSYSHSVSSDSTPLCHFLWNWWVLELRKKGWRQATPTGSAESWASAGLLSAWDRARFAVLAPRACLYF